ncbi:MAG: tryptophan 2,3-dioxygenase family protein [Flavobacteriia bacterium]|nr:tryptophan 2,3-dioxygenase family protein [Flavobacteriia bacterium]
MQLTPEIEKKLEQLNEKYAEMGQDLSSYLDGLLYADVTTYWDYIELETLLSLQKPKTSFPDEKIFIIYHQITELYFKLALHEFEQLGDKLVIDTRFFIDRVTRINRYFEALIMSFDVMASGMEKEQFLKFRMSLLPASGFQSAQYREIEFYSTDIINLVDKTKRESLKNESDIANLFEHIYWKEGATEEKSGKKTLTLTQFEAKYKTQFIALANQCKQNNLWQVYLRLSDEDKLNPEVIKSLRTNDLNVNVYWPLAHYKSAVRYLNKENTDISATGGTNWQKYLPPRFQKRIFYPTLWSQDEIDNWGRQWVTDALT